MRFSTLGRRRIEFLVEFIRIWYTAPDWVKETDRLISEYRKTATKTGPEEQRLFEQAIEKFAADLKVKPDDHEALNNWGIALSGLALAKTGPEQERLLESACEKINKAIEIAASLEEKERTAFYAAHYVHVALLPCALAVERENRGHARRQFDDALDYIPRAKSELVRTELVNFFRGMAKEKTAGLCGEFLDAMRQRDLKDEVDTLEPFAIAVRYWQEGKNEEVLDRLNPELRELVAEIVGVPSEAQAD
jgi:tetratricopeptide (TPR) repeat protein